MKVSIKKLSTEAHIPTKATPGAIAYDVKTPRDYTVRPGRQILPLDIAIELPYGYEAKIEPRSGYASKGMEADINGYSVRANCDVLTGKVDSDYRGCIGVILNNHETTEFVIKAGTRIAQLTIYHGEDADFEEVENLSETKRGAGGFGHTNEQPKHNDK